MTGKDNSVGSTEKRANYILLIGILILDQGAPQLGLYMGLYTCMCNNIINAGVHLRQKVKYMYMH